MPGVAGRYSLDVEADPWRPAILDTAVYMKPLAPTSRPALPSPNGGMFT